MRARIRSASSHGSTSGQCPRSSIVFSAASNCSSFIVRAPLGGGRAFCSPVSPGLVGLLVLDPVGMLGLRLERIGRSDATLAALARVGLPVRLLEAPIDEVRRAEVEPASALAAVGLAATDVSKAAVDLLGARRIVTPRGHAVTDPAIPVVVVADCPAHRSPLLCSACGGLGVMAGGSRRLVARASAAQLGRRASLR